MKKLLIIASFGLFMFQLASCTNNPENEVTPQNEIPDIQANTQRITCGDQLTYADLGGSAIDVAANENYVFRVASNRVVQVYNPTSLNWISLGGQAKRITVDGYNNIWIVNHQNEIYRTTYNASSQTVSGWVRQSGKATDIGASLSGRVYILGDSEKNGQFEVYRRSGSRWIKMSGSGRRIAGGNSGADIWMVNKNNDIYKYVNNRWTKITGRARDIAQSGGSNPHLYIVGNTSQGSDGYDVYVYNGGWCKVRGIGTNIAAMGQFPILTNGRNKIYKGCKVLSDGISSICPF